MMLLMGMGMLWRGFGWEMCVFSFSLPYGRADEFRVGGTHAH